ncbi:M48 family metalloprotease [Kribbella sp. NPDC050281]|uniref:M48 family metalloprotease n=1 Tax=Kribbella sp. NPDC050281 TaxID=3155515 RepID=UPI0033C00F76
MTGPGDPPEDSAWESGQLEPRRPPGPGGPPAVPPNPQWIQLPPDAAGTGADAGSQRARVDVSTATLLLSALPWYFWSFAIVSWIVGLLGFGWGWIIVVAWMLSGAVVFVRPVEDMLARYLFRLRQPTLVEEQRLQLAWRQVIERAGVPQDRYTLWIQDSEEVNATPTPGHVVGVSRWALYTLPPAHLEAALAHELGHHLGGRAWLSLLSFWYSIPARCALIGVRALGRLMLAVPAVGCVVVAFVLLAYSGVLFAVLLLDDSLLLPLLFLTPFVAPPILAWLSRRDVIRADRRAAELGYGATLIQVLYGWQFQHQQMLGRDGSRRRQLMSSYPSLTDRAHALERFLQST